MNKGVALLVNAFLPGLGTLLSGAAAAGMIQLVLSAAGVASLLTGDARMALAGVGMVGAAFIWSALMVIWPPARAA